MSGPGAPYSQLDSRQATVQSFDESRDALRVFGVGGTIVPEDFDSIALTYVASGNGVGEIQTVTYSKDAVPVATLTLAYNADNKLITVTKS